MGMHLGKCGVEFAVFASVFISTPIKLYIFYFVQMCSFLIYKNKIYKLIFTNVINTLVKMIQDVKLESCDGLTPSI